MTAHPNFKRRVRERVQRTGESYVTARRQLLRTREETMTELISVDYAGITKSPDDVQVAVIHLQEQGGPRCLHIFVGPNEAAAIVLATEPDAFGRPMTHDMLKQAVDTLGATPARVLIGYQPGAGGEPDIGVFTAQLTLTQADGGSVTIDCRPSDVIALAARYGDWPEIVVPDAVLTDLQKSLADLHSAEPYTVTISGTGVEPG